MKIFISADIEGIGAVVRGEQTGRDGADYPHARELMTAETPATAESGGILSVLDIERRSHELLVQSFHLFDDSFLVIKTQGIFEVPKVR